MLRRPPVVLSFVVAVVGLVTAAGGVAAQPTEAV